MTVALSTMTWYFSVDCDHDLSSTILKFSIDPSVFPAGGTAGTPVANPPTRVKNTAPPVATGLTRYWWSLLIGQGQPVAVPPGISTVYGRLADTPNAPVYSWRVTLPN